MDENEHVELAAVSAEKKAEGKPAARNAGQHQKKRLVLKGGGESKLDEMLGSFEEYSHLSSINKHTGGDHTGNGSNIFPSGWDWFALSCITSLCCCHAPLVLCYTTLILSTVFAYLCFRTFVRTYGMKNKRSILGLFIFLFDVLGLALIVNTL